MFDFAREISILLTKILLKTIVGLISKISKLKKSKNMYSIISRCRRKPEVVVTTVKNIKEPHPAYKIEHEVAYEVTGRVERITEPIVAECPVKRKQIISFIIFLEGGYSFAFYFEAIDDYGCGNVRLVKPGDVISFEVYYYKDTFKVRSFENKMCFAKNRHTLDNKIYYY